MILSNRSKAPLYNFMSTLLVMLLIFGVTLFIIERYRIDFLGVESYLLLIVPIALWIFYYIRGRQIFEYDSDGEALNFKNRNVVTFFGNTASDEFPKYKLISYDVFNAFVLKKLYVKVQSKKSKYIVLKYDISYLSNREIRDLKASLNKVVKANQEKNTKSQEIG